jgi:hypothetical protein
MSCRIDRVVNAENRVVLFISGRISGEYATCFGVESESDSSPSSQNVFCDREAVKLLPLKSPN